MYAKVIPSLALFISLLLQFECYTPFDSNSLENTTIRQCVKAQAAGDTGMPIQQQGIKLGNFSDFSFYNEHYKTGNICRIDIRNCKGKATEVVFSGTSNLSNLTEDMSAVCHTVLCNRPNSIQNSASSIGYTIILWALAKAFVC